VAEAAGPMPLYRARLDGFVSEAGPPPTGSVELAPDRGVYAPGHLRLTFHGHRTAVVLAVRGSVLTHVSSTALHGVSSAGQTWHVTAAGNTGRR